MRAPTAAAATPARMRQASRAPTTPPEKLARLEHERLARLSGELLTLCEELLVLGTPLGPQHSPPIPEADAAVRWGQAALGLSVG
eukprot:2231592-Prymnesium_polylepis.1